jgi:hypothetical protein
VKIDGKFLPRLHRHENLFSIVRDLAFRLDRIRISAGDVGTIRRLNGSFRSPILVQ